MSVVVIIVAAADSGVDKLNWLAVFKESTAWEKINGTHVLTTFAKNVIRKCKPNAIEYLSTNQKPQGTYYSCFDLHVIFWPDITGKNSEHLFPRHFLRVLSCRVR